MKVFLLFLHLRGLERHLEGEEEEENCYQFLEEREDQDELGHLEELEDEGVQFFEVVVVLNPLVLGVQVNLAL